MTPSSADQTAYHVGVIIGVILFFVMILGFGAFYVLSLVKAMTTRRPGWIITACLCSVPVLIFFVLFVTGFAVGFTRGLNNSAEINAARRGDASQLLTADLTPISGNSIPYQISIPSMDDWQKVQSEQQFDRLFSYHDSAYVGVIAESVGLGSPGRICDISQKHIREKASQFSFTAPQAIKIDSRYWLTYDANATVTYANNDTQIKYRFYVFSDAHNTFQIMTWSVPSLFDHEAPVFDRIAKSFKLPQ